MKKLIIALAALIAIVGALYVGSRYLQGEPLPEALPAPLSSGPARVEEIRCRGRIIPVRWQALSFTAGGRIAHITVQEGASVRRGDLLAELEGEDLSYDLTAAEQALRLAQTRLAQTQATPVPFELQTAQAQVDAARAHLESLRAGPSAAEVRQAELSIDQARNSLWAAQLARDAAGGTCIHCLAYDQARAGVASAEIGVQLAELSYEAAKAGPSAEAVASAAAQLAQAEGNLARLQSGPAEEDLAILRIGVEQAQLALERLQQRQQAAEAAGRLVAPFDGAIVAVSMQEGETAGPGSEVVVLADLSELQVETVDLSDLDVGAVKVDQPVQVVVPGRENTILRGRVSYIAPRATDGAGGQAFYRALVSLNRQDPALRWGMGVDVILGGRGR